MTGGKRILGMTMLTIRMALRSLDRPSRPYSALSAPQRFILIRGAVVLVGKKTSRGAPHVFTSLHWCLGLF